MSHMIKTDVRLKKITGKKYKAMLMESSNLQKLTGISNLPYEINTVEKLEKELSNLLLLSKFEILFNKIVNYSSHITILELLNILHEIVIRFVKNMNDYPGNDCFIFKCFNYFNEFYMHAIVNRDIEMHHDISCVQKPRYC